MSDEDTDVTAGRYEWERIIRRCRLGQSTKAVAFALATYADGDGSRVRPGIDRLALVSELSRRSVLSALKRLRELGLIEQLYRGGHRGEDRMTSAYRLTIPVDLLERVEMLGPDELAIPQRAGGAPSGGPKVQEVHVGEGPNVQLTTPKVQLTTSQGATDDSQGAPGAPHHYKGPATDQPIDQRGSYVPDVTTRGLADMTDEELRIYLEEMDRKAGIAR